MIKKNSKLVLSSDKNAISISSNILNNDKIIATPTDTIYGLAICADKEANIDALFAIKKRPINNPIAILLANYSDAFKYFAFAECQNHILSRFNLLAQNFWPGALTIVAHHKNNLPASIYANSNKLGIRIPNHPFLLKLLQKVNRPLATSSANISGDKNTPTTQSINNNFNDKVEVMIVDKTLTSNALASTVIDITTDQPKILRLGSISKKNLQNTLNEKVV